MTLGKSVMLVTGAYLSMFALVHSRADAQTPGDTAATERSAVNVVNVTALEYALRAPDEIPSGWTTFRLNNEGEEHHFISLMRLPAGKTYEEYEHEVVPPFEKVWEQLRTGDIDKEKAGEMLGSELPEWFWNAEVIGGNGMLAPGLAADATMRLEPGTYVMECYMKSPDGAMHAMEGMSRPLIVKQQSSGGAPPRADAALKLSNFNMELDGNLTAGRRTIAVHFQEHPEVGFGNDLHITRLNDTTDVQEIVRWMDWMEVDGLQHPAPGKFVGGTHELPAGRTAYITVDLEPGRYLFISESTGAQGTMQEVTVQP